MIDHTDYTKKLMHVNQEKSEINKKHREIVNEMITKSEDIETERDEFKVLYNKTLLLNQ